MGNSILEKRVSLIRLEIWDLNKFKILIKTIRPMNLPDGLEDGNIHLEKEPSYVKC